MLLSEVEIGPQRREPLRARESPEGKGIFRRSGCGAVVDRLIRAQHRDSAESMKCREEELVGVEQAVFQGITKVLFADEAVEESSRMGGIEVPETVPRGSLQRSQNAGMRDAMPSLEDCGAAYDPANQTLGVFDDLVHFRVAELGNWSRQVGEVQCLDRLDAEGDLVHDATQTVTRAHAIQKLRIICG